MNETIFSLSTGGLPSGVAIIRISGPQVRFAVETICGPLPDPRHASYRVFFDRDGRALDKGLVLFFPAPHSFTGEDCAEFHLHGSRAVVNAMLMRLGELEGLRQAEAGEFTRQAFANGKMDLTEVEGLSDLLSAETEAQRRAALEQTDGNLRTLYEGWMRRLTHARAMLEAEFDFADEEDIPGAVSDTIWPELEQLAGDIARHVDGLHWGEIVRDGFRVALLGAPNAGKSSLLNKLANRDVAIVSSEAGTTRDLIEVRLDIGGYLVLVQDTAGLRETTSAVEEEGIRRSLKAARSADLVIHLDDGSASDYDRSLVAGLVEERIDVMSVRTKMDLAGPAALPGGDTLGISSLTGEGLERLVEEIGSRLKGYDRSPVGLPNRTRHRDFLKVCLGHVRKAIDVRFDGNELAANELREASNAIGRLTGQVGVEDLLGVIFAEFCVGK